MALPYTGNDALGVYLSGTPSSEAAYGSAASLGGSRLSAEVLPLAFHVENALPQVAIEYVSSACGIGTARLIASGADALRFAAPGEAFGASTSIAVGETVVVPSLTAAKFVRVTRDRAGALVSIGTGSTLSLAVPFNNAFGQGNALVSDCAAAPLVTYRAVFLFNRSDKAITSLVVTGASGTAVGTQAPSEAGTVAAVATERTAPAGVTFGASASVTTLSPNTGVVLWVRRTLAQGTAATPSGSTGISIAWTSEAVSHERTFTAGYAVKGAASFEAYVLLESAPDLSGSPSAVSAALPMAVPILRPMDGNDYTYYVVVRRRNAYGVLGANIHAGTITIDPAGNTVVPPVSAPSTVAIEAAPGGTVKCSAAYVAALDATSADTWLVYSRTDGTDPDPVADTPAAIPMSTASGGLSFAYGSRDTGMFGASTKHLNTTLGPFEWGTDLRVLVRTRRASSGATSINTAAIQHTVVTIPPIPVSHRQALLGFAYGADQPPQARSTTTYSAPYNVRIVRCPGEAQFWIGDECPLRAVVTASGDAVVRIDPAWILAVDESALGAGTGLVEATSATVVYVNVAGTRRVKFDNAAKEIRAAAFWLEAALTDCPSPAAVTRRPSETLLTVWDPSAGRYVAWASAKADGTLAFATPAAQLGA